MTAAKRKRRWIRRVVGVVTALVLLGGAAEVALRLIIPGVVERAIRSELELPEDQGIEVSLGGSALLGALRGGVTDITVGIERLPLLEGISPDVTAHASFVPFDPTSGEISDGTASLVIPADQLGAVVRLLTQDVAQTGRVVDGGLEVGRTLEVFGQEADVTARLGFSVEDGAVRVVPLGASLAGFDMTADRLGEVTGTLLDPVLKPQLVCVEDQIPAGVTLTDIELPRNGAVRIDADLSPGIASDPKQLENGSCGEAPVPVD